MLALALVFAACEAPPASPRPTGASIASPPAPAPTSTPTSPAPSPASPPPTTPERAERVPDWLVGKPFVLQRVVGRFGLPDRIAKGPRQDVIAIVGDRVVTARFIREGLEPGRTRFVVWSFASGARIAPPVTVSGRAGLQGLVAGREVLIAIHEIDHRRYTANGIVAISTVDATIRWLVEPGLPDPDRRIRVLAVSESEKQFGTSLCVPSLETPVDCSPVEIREVANGALVRKVDTGGRPVQRFARDWLVVGRYGFTGVVDPADGLLWSDRGLDRVTFDFAKLVDGRFITRAAGLGGTHRSKLASFEIRTGRYRVLFDPRLGDSWLFLPDLSTDRYMVIVVSSGSGRWCNDCSPDHRALEAGVFDLKTGAYDPDAIYVTVEP